MKTRAILISILSLSVLGLFAQGSIEGNLKNDEGKPLSYANIIVLQNDKIVGGTSSDYEGFYFLDNLKAGNYEVVISYMGNKSEPQTIAIIDRETFVYNTEVMSSTAIGTIVVGPPKNYEKLLDKFEPTVDIISKDFISEVKIKDFGSLIAVSTPVTKDKEGKISFRGSRPGEGTFYVDGLRINGELGIPTAAINSMEIYNGGIPARYGNTTSAVIVIETNSVFDFFD